MILWKDGVEPKDPAILAKEAKAIAGYVGETEVPVTETGEEGTASNTEVEMAEQLRHTVADKDYKPLDVGAFIEKMDEKCAEMMKAAQTRPSMVRAPARPAIKQESQGKEKTTVKGTFPRRVMASGMASSMAGSLPRRRTFNEESLNIVGENHAVPSTLFLLTREATAPNLDLGVIAVEKEKEPELAKIIPIGIPLSEEQRRDEEFYRNTGIKPTDIRAILEPGWTVAEALNPCEQARRAWHRICDCRYDAEMLAVRAKHAVHNFLHKKRPFARPDVVTLKP